MMTLAACKAEDKAPEYTPIMAVEDSKTKAAFVLAEGDVVGIEMEFMGVDINMYRRGDDVHSRASKGTVESFILDGRNYKLNTTHKTVKIEDAAEGAAKKLIDQVLDFRGMVNLEGAMIIENGRESFKFVEYDYEKIVDKEGNVIMVFFDGEMIVGWEKEVKGNHEEVRYVIKNEIPTDLFVIPDDYTVEKPERP